MSLTVYKSSAGSGKTFTLVKEYLKIALKNADGSGLKSILALTFTNKAAAEMKERIIKYLGELCDDDLRPKSDIYHILLADKYLNYDAEELIRRSEILLKQLLHQYSSFSVSTIDRFSHGVIRTFSNELGLAQNFEVSLETNELLKEAIENLISRAGSDKELTKFLTTFSLARIENDQSWRIEDEIFNSSKFILNENAEEYLKPLSKLSLSELSEINKKLKKSVSGFEKSLDQLAENSFSIISNAGLEIKDIYCGSSGGLPSYFKKVLNKDYFRRSSNRLLKTVDEDVWYSKQTLPDVISKIESIKDELLLLYKSSEQILEKSYPKYILELGVVKNFYSTSLINEVYREFENLKKERNVLPISDFNRLIGNVVNEQEAPYIYERIGNHYSHFLIDEFQDTSRLQWQNLMPLIENSIATGNSNLVVGDGKQAIYRWRGGEVDQFVNLPYIRGMENSKILRERIENIRPAVKEFNLGTNYRSKKNIVEFNNQLFSKIIQEKGELSQSIYKEIEQKHLPKNGGGYVEVKVKDEKKTADVPFNDFCIQETINSINSAREQGYEHGEIAILTRNNRQLLMLADELTDKGVPIVSSEVLLIEKSPKVRLLNTYLKLILKPADKHEQLRFLFLIKRVHGINSDSFTIAQSIMKDPSRESFELTLASMGFQISFKPRINCNAYEIIENGISELKLSEVADDYLFAFQHVAHDYFSKKLVSLSGFLHFFSENSAKFSLDLPEGINAVKLLTAHKAKGLEFPVVIFSFANYRVNFQNTIWVKFNGEIEGLPSFRVSKNKEMALTSFTKQIEKEDENAMLDELNIFYVVCTRAVDQLYIITSTAARGRTFSNMFLPTLRKIESWKDEDTFCFGSKTLVERKKEEINDTQEVGLSSMHNYAEGNRYNYLLPEIEEISEEGISARKIGDWIHFIMSGVYSVSDLEGAIEKNVSKYQIPLEVAEFIKKCLKGLMDNPKIQAFYKAEEVENEVEFLDDNGKVLRADRMVVLAGQRIVIDYKTGEELEEHKIQVLEYRDVISKVYSESVLAYLIYTENAKLVAVN